VTAVREPCWCHHCGTWSFRDEWGKALEVGDTCPECGDAHPGGGFEASNEPGGDATRLEWAATRTVNW
jgi:hypothetical protein